MVDMSRVSTQTNRSNLEHAFCAAEQLGVARLLDPEGEIHRHCHVWFVSENTNFNTFCAINHGP